MGQVIKKFGLWFVLGILWLVGSGTPQKAQACVAFTPSIESLIKDFDTITVSGEVIETDSTLHNGVFKVSHYLRGGSGAEYITIHNAPANMVDTIRTGINTDCDSVGEYLPGCTNKLSSNLS